MQPIKKIVAVGPESTGKSTLCAHLGNHYETLWCREFARDYLIANGNVYNYDSLLTIARGQLMLEDECTAAVVHEQSTKSIAHSPIYSPLSVFHSSLLFIDTDMYVMKVWCEFVFKQCHQYILNEIAKRKYDLYLLCNIDLPWTPDPLREYPDIATRKELYSMYKDLLTKQQTPWVEINGTNEERVQHAVEAVEKYCGNQ